MPLLMEQGKQVLIVGPTLEDFALSDYIATTSWWGFVFVVYFQDYGCRLLDRLACYGLRPRITV